MFGESRDKYDDGSGSALFLADTIDDSGGAQLDLRSANEYVEFQMKEGNFAKLISLGLESMYKLGAALRRGYGMINLLAAEVMNNTNRVTNLEKEIVTVNKKMQQLQKQQEELSNDKKRKSEGAPPAPQGATAATKRDITAALVACLEQHGNCKGIRDELTIGWKIGQAVTDPQTDALSSRVAKIVRVFLFDKKKVFLSEEMLISAIEDKISEWRNNNV